MKKMLLFIIGLILLVGCTNKEMVSFYENTKAGGKVDSYQLDIRIYGTIAKKTYSDFVKVDNFKGTQFKVDYISKNQKILEKGVDEESKEPTEDPKLDMLLEDNASYIIDDKKYEKVDGQFKEVTALMYSNPNVYLEGVNKGSTLEKLADETVGDSILKVYTFKVSIDNMKNILDDGILKDLVLKEDVSAKLWINKENRISKVVYYIKDGTDKVEINVSVFRINLIKDMSNNVR